MNLIIFAAYAMPMKNVRAILGLSALLLLQLIAEAAIAQSPLIFKHLTVEDGLSSGSVLSVAQDNKGFIWAGTMDGLNRYDGTRVKVFKSFYRDNFIGASIKINQLCADEYDNVWIGTNNGLYVYNIKLDSFRVYYHSPADKNSLCHNDVKALCFDNRKNLWVGTEAGISIFTRTGSFGFKCSSVSFDTNDSTLLDVSSLFQSITGRMFAGTANGLVSLATSPSSRNWRNEQHILQGNKVTAIAEDQYQNIWAGTASNGIFRISGDNGLVRHFARGKNIDEGPISNIIRKIIRDKNGKLWIGTLKGLDILDPVSLKFETYVHDPGDDRTLNFNSIWDIMQDRQGSMWVATFFGGLNVAESISTPFKVYRNEGAKNTISSNVVNPIINDGSGNLWVGTEAEGLNFIDRKTNIIKQFRNDETNPASLSSNLVKTLIRDDQNNIWVGMHGGGINVLTSTGKKIKEFNSNTKSGALNSNDVIALLYDGEKRIWVGTEENGVDVIDLATNRVEKFEDILSNRRLTNKAITCFFRDSKNNIWIGTRQGLNKLHADGENLTGYLRNNVHGKMLSDYINCIAEDKHHKIWIGTYEGLCFYDPDKNAFVTFSASDGLAGNKVTGILNDDNDNLWISTNGGLSFLDAARKVWHTFTVEDGLPANVFNYNSYFKDLNGHMFFGTFKGLVEFTPQDIQTNGTAPDVVLTGLAVNGKQISKSDSTGILSGNILQTKDIELKYDQNVITVDYAVLNFIKSGKNKSAYKLEGYDADWQFTHAHSATFNSLQPGHYRLLVKAGNNDGIWTQSPTALGITILPPPWKTWWAYTFYFLVTGLIASIIVWFVSSRTALRRKLKYEHMLAVKQQELHQMKMDFYTHISHEIRTPLSLIMGPVEMLMMKLSGRKEDQRLLEMIKTNAERLLKLATDLLEVRKIDTGHMKLTIEPRDIVPFVGTVFEKFREMADKKMIAYQLESSEKSCLVYFDAHYLEIVVSNLLSNALKFTPEHGKVWLKIQRKAKEIDIEVHDNGPGIPKENQDKIFSTFYRADNAINNTSGTGIGLAFSKSLVELHGGKLVFRSDDAAHNAQPETCFTITLTLEKEYVPKSIVLNSKVS
ncbi:two-component regulator propeller domain-containing protein [Danxiaibacter flavus]|uniref:histidine kinase n=1 Tax=Danxiaibacter flavus TaxID=3049108 RepID=A0ABV3ZJE2_9BACT|nr:two-component regulator propeller domain-containing protein [Chitinophagaceae bacterium DXS]